MKTKLVLTAIVLASLQNLYAQETIRQSSRDSIYKSNVDDERKENQKRIEESTRKTADESENRVNQLEKNQNKQEHEQNKLERGQSKVISAERSVSDSQNKLANQQKNSGRMQRKFNRAKRNGNLTPVQVEKGNVRNAKQQLRIKETEEDIQNAKKKLNKVEDKY